MEDRLNPQPLPPIDVGDLTARVVQALSSAGVGAASSELYLPGHRIIVGIIIDPQAIAVEEAE